MGGSESKEEVIISQAGNSGGITDEANTNKGCSLLEVIGIVFAGLVIVFILYSGYRIISKRLERKIRREIARSRELSTV